MSDSDCELVDDPEPIEAIVPDILPVTSSVPVSKKRKNQQPETVVLDDASDDDVIALPQETKKEFSYRKIRRKPREPRILNGPCLNPNCETKLDLMRARDFDFQYFSVKRRKKSCICYKCAKEADERLNLLSEKLDANDFILGEKEFKLAEDVVDVDSDEEEVEEEVDSDSSDDQMLLVNMKEFKDLVSELDERKAHSNQFEMGIEKMTKEVSKLELDFNTELERLTQVEKGFNTTYQDLYQYVRPEIKELPSIDISTIIEVEVTPQELQAYEEQKIKQKELNKKMVQQAYATNSRGVDTTATIRSSHRTKKANTSSDKDDVMAVERVSTKGPILPPPGPLHRPELKENEVVRAMKQCLTTEWGKATILTILRKEEKEYRVRLEGNYKRNAGLRYYTGKHLAYPDPSPVLLPVGTRCLAKYVDEAEQFQNAFFAGVIAEPPKSMNKYRYLVFFDDGYASYVTHNDVRVIVESSKNVSEDVHPGSREFVKKYLAQYPERPMVKLQEGQNIRIEWHSRWWTANVQEVDASLVKMKFDADQRTEWIYRGSTRLAPLYNQQQRMQETNRSIRRHNVDAAAARGKKKAPYVEYTVEDNEDIQIIEPPKHDSQEKSTNEAGPSIPAEPPAERPRSMARKSTATAANKQENKDTEISANLMAVVGVEHAGYFQKIQVDKETRLIPQLKFVPHQCSYKCFPLTTDILSKLKGKNPLIKPLLLSFTRHTAQRCMKTSKMCVFYVAPCGRRLRTIQETFRYLRATGSSFGTIGIQDFCFDFFVHISNEFHPEKVVPYSSKDKEYLLADVSYGKENIPITCVNSLDRQQPEYVEYCTDRIPTGGVNLNLDPEFLCGCDCTDDCQDQSACQCWQLTLKGIQGSKDSKDVKGYVYRRLYEQVKSGIFECNQRCKCKSSCLNRVVQRPLECRLQMFKTSKRGWAIRCLDDIPHGAFICIYAGQLLTEAYADQDGKNFGDEYLAELDYIEVMEKIKAGYESNVEMSDDSDKSSAPDSSDGDSSSEDVDNSREPARGCRYEVDKDFKLHSRGSSRRKTEEDAKVSTRNRRVAQKKTSKEEEDKRKKNAGRKKGKKQKEESDDEEDKLPSFPSVRKYFNEEDCYIMDAKTIGNIGRYLNHSCSPNVFVQNVFVDTHDLRFPWVSFFALTFIRGGTELTWDYNYEVGSVPGRRLYCYCGSEDCRGRLL